MFFMLLVVLVSLDQNREQKLILAKTSIQRYVNLTRSDYVDLSGPICIVSGQE